MGDKEANLIQLSHEFNTARFISFTLTGEVSHFSLGANACGTPVAASEAIRMLFAAAESHKVNIRTFRSGEDAGRSYPFLMNLESVDDVLEAVSRFACQGLRSICNESIDIGDGGVSGVVLGDLVECAPNATPRAVEGADVARLSRWLAEKIMSRIYSAKVTLPGDSSSRTEFSVHPGPRGVRASNVVVWASEPAGSRDWKVPVGRWPNRLSRHVGDKVFGLLVADTLGFNVPFSRVVNRAVAPFEFGRRTATGQFWIRTAPEVPEPGHFPTLRSWIDPFKLLGSTPGSERVMSVISQEGVAATHSGGAFVGADERIVVEGVAGLGDLYMLGEKLPTDLPSRIDTAVRRVMKKLVKLLGPVRIEWVHDSKKVWIVQLHCGASPIRGQVINPGDADKWVEVDSSLPLEDLGQALERVPPGAGVIVAGDVGLASHKMELIIRSGRPARFTD